MEATAKKIETEAKPSYDDLAQMLANLQKAHEAAIAQAAELQDRNSSLGFAIAGTKAAVTDLENSNKTLRSGKVDPFDVRGLALARRLIKSGKTADGLYELERILDRMDSAWRTFA